MGGGGGYLTQHMCQVTQLLFITQHARCAMLMLNNGLEFGVLLPFGRLPGSHSSILTYHIQPLDGALSKLPHTVHCTWNQAWSNPSVVLIELWYHAMAHESTRPVAACRIILLFFVGFHLHKNLVCTCRSGRTKDVLAPDSLQLKLHLDPSWSW